MPEGCFPYLASTWSAAQFFHQLTPEHPYLSPCHTPTKSIELRPGAHLDNYNKLIDKITNRTAKTAVVGLGYVGLPQALYHAQAGYDVTGIERMPHRVADINQGRSYIDDVSSEDISAVVESGNLHATSEFTSVGDVDVITVCVPTPLDRHKQPDTSYIEFVLDQSRPFLRAGQLVILESTTYPGTTVDVVLPKLEPSKLEVGKDIFVAYSPERIDPGNTSYPPNEIPRVVAGITPRCLEVATAFYEQILRAPVVPVSSPDVAEMTKLFENVFRVVNVSLVNELAQLCERMDIDVWEVIDAAKTKPYGFMAFYPGPGVGGHCIPIDPFYLSWKAREHDFTTRFIELAGAINDDMPAYVVTKITEILNDHGKPLKGSKVLILGVAFKPDVADARESASVKVAEGLIRHGAEVSYHDPYFPSMILGGEGYKSVPLTADYLRAQDAVVIASDHTNVDYELIASNSPLVYDTRNALKGNTSQNIFRLGGPKVAAARVK